MFVDGRLDRYGFLDAWRLLDLWKLVESCDLLVVEDQYFSGFLRGAKTLIRVAWEPVVLAKLQEKPFQLVQAATWRRRLWGRIREPNRQAWKQRAVAEVERRFGLRVSSDLAEAICMGLAMLKCEGRGLDNQS